MEESKLAGGAGGCCDRDGSTSVGCEKGGCIEPEDLGRGQVNVSSDRPDEFIYTLEAPDLPSVSTQINRSHYAVPRQILLVFAFLVPFATHDPLFNILQAIPPE